MAKTSNLREFQEAILLKLKEATAQGEMESSSRLGVMVGNQRMLVNLRDIIEVLPVPEYKFVPFTQPWFLGVANVRGVLYNVSDLAQFMQLTAMPKSANNRILLLNSHSTTQTALVVTSLVGLRNISDMEIQPSQNERLLTKQIYLDENGFEWAEIDLEALLQNEMFIQPTI